ncbi:MAG: hemerythrin domain-containing protein [Pseudomonadales bacterium]
MRATDTFRKHHEDILSVAGEIDALLSEDKVVEESKNISRLLAKFAGKLKGHLVMEDQVLYPKLMDHSDPQINNMAARFLKEMGGIAETVEQYCATWRAPDSIAADPKTFIVQTKRLFSALQRRIDNEDNILYPALDSIDT